MSSIRASKEWGLRPTTVVMSDPHFGHRDLETGAPIGDSKEWTEWDYALITAYQTVEDWTDQHGNLVWEVNDPHERVIVTAKKKIDKFDAQKTIRTSGKNYKPTPGEYFVSDLSLKPGAEWPTMEEYVKAEVEREMGAQAPEYDDGPSFVS